MWALAIPLYIADTATMHPPFNKLHTSIPLTLCRTILGLENALFSHFPQNEVISMCLTPPLQSQPGSSLPQNSVSPASKGHILGNRRREGALRSIVKADARAQSRGTWPCCWLSEWEVVESSSVPSLSSTSLGKNNINFLLEVTSSV